MGEIICDICELTITGKDYYCTSEVTVCKSCADRASEIIPNRKVIPHNIRVYGEKATRN